MRTLLVAALALTGCMKQSEKYCQLNGAEDPEHCPPPDAAGGSCQSTVDCTAGVCDPMTHTCVECFDANGCGNVEPVCNLSSHTCEACDAHADCVSQVCLPDGSCAAGDAVAYVDTAGGGSECSLANPCDKIDKGLVTDKEFVKLTGSFDDNVVIDNHAAVTLVGAAGARISKSSGNVLELRGTSVVTVVGLTIGATNGTQTVGVAMAPGASGSVELVRTVVTNHGMGGIRVENGTLRMSRSSVLGNGGGGVIVRSGASMYVIRNNFIVDNGRSNGTGATFQGGALLEADVGGKFEYNTVAYNGSSGIGTTPIRPGVHCLGNNSAIGNVVVNNTDGVMGRNDNNQAGGTCDLGNSYRNGDAGSVGFKAPLASPPDLHLTATSPTSVRDAAADCTAIAERDYDGQSRPYGGACDLGADEYMP